MPDPMAPYPSIRHMIAYENRITEILRAVMAREIYPYEGSVEMEKALEVYKATDEYKLRQQEWAELDRKR